MKAGLYLCLFSSVLLLSACDKTEQSNTTTEVAPATEVAQEVASATEVAQEVAPASEAPAAEASEIEPAVVEVAEATQTEATSTAQEGAAEPSVATASELASLQQYLAKYPNEGENFLTISPLKERLAALLGDDLAVFLANLQTTGPLSEEGGVLFITGNKDNEGGQNAAALVADPSQDALYVWLLKDGVAKEFKEAGKEVTLPSDVKATQENAVSAS